MTDSQTQAENTETQESGDAQEQTYWSKLVKLLDERVDAGVERAVKKYSGVSRSRNGGRQTIPGAFADFFWGPEKPKDE